jgi:hypothetical protein
MTQQYDRKIVNLESRYENQKFIHGIVLDFCNSSYRLQPQLLFRFRQGQ